MTTRPALLQIPGRKSSLLISPEDDAQVTLSLRGMQIKFTRRILPCDLTSFDFPHLQNWEIEDLVDLLMRGATVQVCS